jgi:DnaK suppressor protein
MVRLVQLLNNTPQEARMTPFTPAMAPRFRELLIRRAAELQAALAREEAEEQAAVRESDAHEVTDLKELAEEQTLTTVHEMQHQHAAQELEQVHAALHRLDAGQYGLCRSCGEAIELRRLEALPAALRCTRCQGEAEHRR